MAKKTYSNEEVAKKYESLPEEVKNLLYSFEMTSVITKVGEKNGLHIDQMDKLNTETGYVMMGLTETKDFPAIIAQDLQIDPTKAHLVANDIEEMLFSKIRDAMKTLVAPPAPVINATSSSKPPLSEVLPTSTTLPTVPSAPATPPAPMAAVPAMPAPVALEIPPQTQMPEIKLEVKPSDIILTQPTVAKTSDIAIKTQGPASAAPIIPPITKAEPPKPQDYKADPYREPTV